MKKYNKKTYAVLIITTLLIGSLPLTGGMTQKNNEEIITNNNGDQLDQRPSRTSNGAYSSVDTLAQSFKPSLPVLTRVRLPMYGNTNVEVSIRKDKEGSILRSVTVNIPYSYELNFVECDFEDLIVTPGSTYYIVVDLIGPYGFAWMHSTLNTYSSGSAWSLEFLWGWKPLSGDLYFETYGTNGNVPPNTPDTPFGETNCIKSNEYDFSTQTADANNDPIYFLFDWDDGTNSGWIGPRASEIPIIARHSWDQTGSYNIKVKAKDNKEAESYQWSEPLTIHVWNSARPYELELNECESAGTPVWPENGTKGQGYSFSAKAYDIELNDIYYLFDWGDGTDSGWLGPYPAGQLCEASHAWYGRDIYKLRVKAKDTTGAESDWSEALLFCVSTKPGVVYGTLTDYDGNPIADYPVSMNLYYWRSAGIENPSTSMRTDGNGNFYFKGIPFDKKYVSGLKKGQPLEFEVYARRDTWGANYEYGWQTFNMPRNGEYVLHKNVCLNHETCISKSKDIFHSQSLLCRVIIHLLSLF